MNIYAPLEHAFHVPWVFQSAVLAGVLLALGTVRFYRGLMDRPHLARVVRGLNAGVVGLLAAAWWDPIVREGLTSPLAVGIATGAALALASGRIPAWAVVLGAASAGAWWA